MKMDMMTIGNCQVTVCGYFHHIAHFHVKIVNSILQAHNWAIISPATNQPHFDVCLFLRFVLQWLEFVSFLFTVNYSNSESRQNDMLEV